MHISRNQMETGDGVAACTWPSSRRSAAMGGGLERSENERVNGTRAAFAANNVEAPMSLPSIDIEDGERA